MELMKLQNGSDIRGVALENPDGRPVTLTEEACRAIGRGLARWLCREEKRVYRVALGRDCRLSGAELIRWMGEELAAEGMLVTTPAMFMSTVTEGYAYDAAVMVTASHLPFERNGYKFFTPAGGLGSADIKTILTLAAEDRPRLLGGGRMEQGSFLDTYAAQLREKIVSATDETIRNTKWVESWDTRYFTATLRMEYTLYLWRIPMVEQLSAYTQTPIHDIKTLKLALSRMVDKYVERGVLGLKTTHAYFRTLACEKVDEATANAVFLRALKGEALTDRERRQFEDHMIYNIVQLCREKGLLFQVHTGLQHCFADISDANPLYLTPLLQEFRDVQFDIFHAGMPFIHEFGILCKLFPNAYANFAWTYLISPSMARTALSECIDLVPGNRILAFGSDVKYPEFIGGQLDMAFSCVADVLEEKIRKDFLSETEAFALIDKMFTSNGCELYRLS